MRADRLLSILLQLQLHGQRTGKQLAKRLEVSERTIHRDMQALAAAGVPLVAERGAGGGWSLMEGYRTQLTGLTETEVRALFVSGPARILSDLKLDKAADGALIKLLTALPSMFRRNAEIARQRIHVDVSGWKGSAESVPYLPLLQDAVWRERRVRMVYGESPERTVDPLGLVAKGSTWYLVAAIDGDVRTYRIARVRAAEIVEEPFVRPPEFDLPRYWEESAARFRERLPRFPVVIRAAKEMLPWIQAMIRYGGIDRTDDEEDRLRIAMHFDSAEVAQAVLLGIGDRVEVLDPPSLRQAIMAMAARIATGVS